MSSVRIDKWLWSVRIFKSRNFSLEKFEENGDAIVEGQAEGIAKIQTTTEVVLIVALTVGVIIAIISAFIIIKIKISDATELDALLSAAAYAEVVNG